MLSAGVYGPEPHLPWCDRADTGLLTAHAGLSESNRQGEPLVGFLELSPNDMKRFWLINAQRPMG